MRRESAMARPHSWSYDGILACPIQDIVFLPGLFAEAPADWFIGIGGRPEQWKPFSMAVAERLVKICADIVARLEALREAFEIPSRPGWERNLSLSLAMRHEPWVFAPPHVRLAELCESLDLSVDAPDRDLVMRLAEKHVPGFAMLPPKIDDRLYLHLQPILPWFRPDDAQQGRLSTREIVYLCIADMTTRMCLQHTGAAVSDRSVAQFILNELAKSGEGSTEFSREISSIIKKRGNRKPGKRGFDNRMSERTLRGYLREMRTATHDLQEGNSTAFQRRFRLVAFPTIRQLIDTAWADDRLKGSG
jgi:hypothetical protein